MLILLGFQSRIVIVYFAVHTAPAGIPSGQLVQLTSECFLPFGPRNCLGSSGHLPLDPGICPFSKELWFHFLENGACVTNISFQILLGVG